MQRRWGVSLFVAVLGVTGAAFLHPSGVLAGQEAAKPKEPEAVDTGHYQLADNWAQIPDSGKWGVMSDVGTDAKGNVYAFQRSDPKAAVMVFDRSGKFLRSWGTEELEFPHGLRVGPDGNVWIADKKREQVLKFSPEGKLLMTIGKRDFNGGATDQDAFDGISDVAVTKSGDIYVSDGENSVPATPPFNNRVVKFTKDGKFVKYWGEKGDGPSQFVAPHCLAIDSKGRVFLGDRGNKRIQVFDADGKLLTIMTQFGAPTSIYISKDDTVYVGDGNKVVVGKTDGTIIDTIANVPDPHGIAVDEGTGTIYVAQVGPKAILKFVKKK